jgi:hypothetical protein
MILKSCFIPRDTKTAKARDQDVGNENEKLDGVFFFPLFFLNVVNKNEYLNGAETVSYLPISSLCNTNQAKKRQRQNFSTP